MPNEVNFCSKCVISNQRPNSVVEFKNKATDNKSVISIGEDGVCSACNYNDIKNKIDWNERDLQLVELCKKIKKIVKVIMIVLFQVVEGRIVLILHIF